MSKIQNPIVLKSKLSEIHNQLKKYWGSISEVSRQMNCSSAYTHIILRGEASEEASIKFMNLAIEVLERKKEEKKEKEIEIEIENLKARFDKI